MGKLMDKTHKIHSEPSIKRKLVEDFLLLLYITLKDTEKMDKIYRGILEV